MDRWISPVAEQLTPSTYERITGLIAEEGAWEGVRPVASDRITLDEARTHWRAIASPEAIEKGIRRFQETYFDPELLAEDAAHAQERFTRAIMEHVPYISEDVAFDGCNAKVQGDNIRLSGRLMDDTDHDPDRYGITFKITYRTDSGEPPAERIRRLSPIWWYRTRSFGELVEKELERAVEHKEMHFLPHLVQIPAYVEELRRASDAKAKSKHDRRRQALATLDEHL